MGGSLSIIAQTRRRVNRRRVFSRGSDGGGAFASTLPPLSGPVRLRSPIVWSNWKLPGAQKHGAGGRPAPCSGSSSSAAARCPRSAARRPRTRAAQCADSQPRAGPIRAPLPGADLRSSSCLHHPRSLPTVARVIDAIDRWGVADREVRLDSDSVTPYYYITPDEEVSMTTSQAGGRPETGPTAHPRQVRQTFRSSQPQAVWGAERIPADADGNRAGAAPHEREAHTSNHRTYQRGRLRRAQGREAASGC
jgi:hypothetical protein